jgi:hypothetical protein
MITEILTARCICGARHGVSAAPGEERDARRRLAAEVQACRRRDTPAAAAARLYARRLDEGRPTPIPEVARVYRVRVRDVIAELRRRGERRRCRPGPKVPPPCV